MSLLDKRTTSDAVKLLVFIVVTTVATSLLVITIGNISFNDKLEYKAVFSDATGVVKGDDVRIAGVKVGSVSDVEIHEQTQAVVTFSVDTGSKVTDGTNVAIRGCTFLNLDDGVNYIQVKVDAGVAWYGRLSAQPDPNNKTPIELAPDLKAPVLGLYAVVALLVIAMALSDFVNNAATTAIMAPLAFSTAAPRAPRCASTASTATSAATSPRAEATCPCS